MAKQSWEDLPDIVPETKPGKVSSWEDLPDVDVEPSPEEMALREKEHAARDLGANMGRLDTVGGQAIEGNRFENKHPTAAKVLRVGNEFIDSLPEKARSLPEKTRGLRAGLAQGLSAKFSDELEGGLNAVLAGGGLKINDNDDLSKGVSLRSPALGWDELKKSYTDARDARRGKLKQAEKDQPVGYTVGEVGGSMLLPGPKVAGAKTAWEAAKLGAKYGAPLALANTIGGDEDKPGELSMPSVPQMAFASGAGALFGGAGAAGGQKVGGLLARKAEERAVKAAGARAGITNQLKSMGLTDDADVQQAGREFLNRKLIPWFGDESKVLQNAENLLNDTGTKISGHLDKADTGPVPFDYARFGAAADAPVGKANAVEQLAAGKAKVLAEALEDQGKLTPGSFRGANQAKSSAWQGVNFGADDAKAAPKLFRQTVTAARDNIREQLAEAFEQQALQQGLSPAAAKAQAAAEANAYKRAAEGYHVGSQAKKLAEEALTRNAAKDAPTMTSLAHEALLGGFVGHQAGGHGVLGGAAGLLMPFASRAAKKYGATTATRALDLGSDVAGAAAEKAPNMSAPLAQWLSLLGDDQQR